jgi:hypothetical protein
VHLVGAGKGTHRSFDSICPQCPQGPSSWYPAGSFLAASRLYAAGLGEDFRWENYFPPEVIEREALLHIAFSKHLLRKDFQNEMPF